MTKVRHLLQDPLSWLYFLAVVLFSCHILLTRVGNNGVDFYNFWMVPQILRDLKTTDIYVFEKQPEFGTYYFNKYYDSPEPIDKRTSYEPLPDIPNYDLQKDYTSSSARFFSFTDPLKEKTDLQRTSAFRRVFPDFTGTPFLYTFTSLFETGDFARDYLAFRILGLASVILAMLVMCHLLQISRASAFLLSSIFLFFFYPIRQDADVGNVMNFQLGLLSLFLWFSSLKKPWAPVAAGFFLALSIMLKPSTIFVVPCLLIYWLFKKKWKVGGRTLIGLVTGTTFAILTAAVFFGTMQPWERWYTLVFRKILKRTDYLSEMTNFSPPQLFFEVTHGNSLLISIVIMTVTLGLIILPLLSTPVEEEEISGHREDFLDVFLITALGCGAMLLSSKLVWHFYQVLYIPLFLYLFKQFCDGDEESAWRKAGLFLVFLAFCAMSIDGQDWRFRFASGLPLACANVIGATSLFVLGSWELRRRVKRENL